jgi:hypothetical protein
VSKSTTKRSGASQGPKLRVFVSSVIEGFADYRAAARKGIEAAGAQPVMVNEDFPSQGTSSRNACLDAIDSSDCLLSIVGSRGGWTAPSGRLVVEEEFEHARVRSLPVLAFMQETMRDADAERFVRRLSDYVEGMFRTKFQTPAELQQQVERAVRGRVEAVSPRSVEERDLSSYFVPERHSSGGATMLRLVLEPERQQEVIDPVQLASVDFKERLLELGHGKDVRLFNYSRGKSVELEGPALVVEQDDSNARHGGEDHVRLELAESGRVLLDGNVTGRSGDDAADAMRDTFVIAVENIEDLMARFFRFSAALYAEIDGSRRHERFHYNVGLRGLGYRSLERGRKPKQSYGASTRSSDAVTAFATSRVLSRAALVNDARNEIGRVIVLLERAARD